MVPVSKYTDGIGTYYVYIPDPNTTGLISTDYHNGKWSKRTILQAWLGTILKRIN